MSLNRATVDKHDLLVASQQMLVIVFQMRPNGADAISHPQFIPDLGSVVGVPIMGGLIINTNDVAGTCPMLLEHNLVKNITG